MKINGRTTNLKSIIGAAGALLALTTAHHSLAQAPSPIFTNIWNVGSGTNALGGLPNDLPNLGTANNVRGIAISPTTTNVLYASTTGGTNGGNTHVTTLDFTNNGAFIGQNNGSGISGGTLGMTQVRVSDDGFVYACNLAGAPASNFKIYRWPSDTDFSTAPTVVYNSGAGTSFQWRVGDYMDLRGSGLNTEIVATGNGTGANVTTNFVIFRPTDASATTFTNFSITIPGSPASSICGGGVTFEGTNNVIYVKAAGGKPVYRLAYNPATLTAQVTATFNMDQSFNNGLKYYETNGVKLFAAVCTATTALTNGIQHYAKILQLTDPSNAVVVLNQPLPVPNQANGNSLGLVDFVKGCAAFSEPNNGISLYALTGFITNTPAKISTQPAGAYVVGTFNYTLTVDASGTLPRKYQWYFATATATNALASQTNTSLLLTNLSLTQSGGYFATVTNNYGSDTSAVATVTVLPGNFSSVMTPLWSLAPGSRSYLTTDNTQRGLAYDPVTGHLVLVSRAPTNGVHILNSTTGADLGDLDLSTILSLGSPGTYPINMAGVADDGVVFVCNLLTTTTSDNFAIYRWDSANSTAAPAVTSYYGNPAIGRIGDTFAARGSGVGTELIASFRTGTNVAVFTTGDGYYFTPNIIAVTNLPADAQANGFAGLGLAWGPTNTFWAKSSGFKLRLVQYDIPSLTGWVIADYDAADSTMYPIGVDNANGLVAGVGAGELPQNLEIFNLWASGGPTIIDRELFPANNANGNGTGSVGFDVPNGRLFALDSNNGIVAASYIPLLRYALLNKKLVMNWAGPAALRSSANAAGPYTLVPGASSPFTNSSSGPIFYLLSR